MLFAPRAPDMTEYQHTTTEGPPAPVYTPIEQTLAPRVLFSKEPLVSPGQHLHSPLAVGHPGPHLHNPLMRHSYSPPTPAKHLTLPSRDPDGDSGASCSPEPGSEHHTEARRNAVGPLSCSPKPAALDTIAATVKDGLTLAY